LDELVKIGEAAEDKSNKRGRLMRSLKAALVASAGGAVGYGAGEALINIPSPVSRFLKAKKPVSRFARGGARIGLPILGGLAITLGARHRKKLDDEMSRATPSNVRRT
jgi:hypothetical protein